MEEKIVEKAVEEGVKNEQVIKAAVKSGKGKAGLFMLAGAGIMLFVDKIVVPACKKVAAKRKDKAENPDVVDGEAQEIE